MILMVIENLQDFLTTVISAHIIYRYRFIELFALVVLLIIFALRSGSFSGFSKSISLSNVENKRKLLVVIISLIAPISIIYILMRTFQSSPFLSMVVLSLGVPFITVFGIKGMSELIEKDTQTTALFHRRIEKKQLFLMLLWIILLSFLIRFYFTYIRYYPRTGSWDTPRYFRRMILSSSAWEQNLPRNPFYILYIFLVSNGLDLIIMPRLVIPLIYSLSIIPFYLLTTEITNNEKTGILSSFLFAMCAESIRLIGDLYRNVFGIYFLIWSLFFTIKCINSRRKFLFGFLAFFYLALTSLTHEVCFLVYFIVMITYSLAALVVQHKKNIGFQWLISMIPFIVAAIIYSIYFPGFLISITKPIEPIPAVIPLARLGNNWFFSVATDALALIGVYFSIKKRDLQYVFGTSFLISIYAIWLLSGPVFGFWYFLVRIPERFYLFAFIPASFLGGLALTHILFTKKFRKHWKSSLIVLSMCLSMSGYDIVSVVYFDYFYPPLITAREFKAAYWLEDNAEPQVAVLANQEMGANFFWLSYYLLDSRTVYQMRPYRKFEYYDSILETYYVFISSLSPRVSNSDLNNIIGLNRIYYDAQVTIYARL